MALPKVVTGRPTQREAETTGVPLRPRHHWPRRRTSETRDELAPSHHHPRITRTSAYPICPPAREPVVCPMAPNAHNELHGLPLDF